MLRYYITLAAVGLIVTAAAGREELAGRTDQRESASQSPVITDLAFAPETLPLGSAQKEATDDAGEGAGATDLTTDAASANQISPECNQPDRPYRPVCDCACHVHCLDKWCTWDVVRCDSCWCDVTPCACAQGKCRLTDDGQWVCNDACCDVWGPPVYCSDAAVRFGYWAIGNDGSQQKTGEFQDLHSFPFWDVDAISSDGVRTWDIVLSGLDQETSDARIHYYGPEGSAKIDFQRFIHRLDHNPVVGYVLAPGEVPPPTPAGDVIADDLNVGEDYAIRVEELNSKFQGKITDNVKWRLNVWSQRKFGERQANAMAHCFNVLADAPAGATGNVCHKLSQRQTIDWTTVEVKPGIEARFENVTVDYSHTIRTFGADDQAVDRTYTHFGFSPSNNILGPPYDYAIVPDSSTNIDRVKIAAAITDDNQFYGNLYHGETKNEFRDLERTYNGYDLRLTNRSIDDVKLTAYTSRYEEDNSFPPTIFDSPPLAPASTYDEDSLVHPVNYTRTRAGLKGSWQPYGDRGMRCSNYGIWDGTSLAAGYEYYQLERAYATYETTPIPPGPFTQPDTITHQVEFGPSTHWSRSLDTFVRYKVQFIDNPLVGVSQYSEEDPTIPGTFNSSLPERVNNVELGGTWTPASNFLTTAQFTIMNSSNRSDFANFSENDYPMVFTVWYAPTSRLSLTGGYAYYSNWIDQDITLGTYRGDPTATETARWNYAGQNHLFSFSAHYAWSECVQLIGGYEWDRGTNTFEVPPSTGGADWSLLPSLADVIVETQRLTAGVDWQPMRNTDVYLRYIFFDYNDISSGLYSGTSNMALAGATRTW